MLVGSEAATVLALVGVSVSHAKLDDVTVDDITVDVVGCCVELAASFSSTPDNTKLAYQKIVQNFC